MGSRAIVRVLVLDGLDWEWCSAHRDEVPGLWALAEDGYCAPLRSTKLPITPSAVAALLCGRDVDMDWVKTRGVGGDVYATAHDLIRQRPWPRAMADADYTTALVNVPLTWPAAPAFAGASSRCVSGWPIPVGSIGEGSRPWHWPRRADWVAGYPIHQLVQARSVDEMVSAETELVDWFLSQERADLEILWLRATDVAGHTAWGTETYAATARWASDMALTLRGGTDNLVVISDHGFDAIDSPRCAAYHRTTHGPTSRAAGMTGAHAEEGILFAAGDRIVARGVGGEQRLLEVAGGLFDLLGVPPVQGMTSVGPEWATPVSTKDDDDMRERLVALGYM